MDAEQVARDVYGRFGTACGELAFEEFQMYDTAPRVCSEEASKKFREAKEQGVTDLCGWYADELYNDTDTMYMMCDWIYDMVCQYGVDKKEVYEELKKIGHDGVKQFVEQYLK